MRNFNIMTLASSNAGYEVVSKSFRTESVLLVEKQYKRLWRQYSLDWLTK